MTEFLLKLPTAWSAVVAAVLAIAVTVLADRFTRAKRRDLPENTTVSTLHATVATIYTVLLAFVVVIVWQSYDDAESTVVIEATRVSNILRDSQALAPADHLAVQEAMGRYLTLTGEREWDYMAHGNGAEPETNQAYERIWEVVYEIEPSGFVEESFYQELLVRLNELGAARRTRLLSAEASVPPLLWLLLLGGAAIVGFLSFLLPNQRERGSLLALCATGCVIALTLFLIFVMDHPYTGDFSVQPDRLLDLVPRTVAAGS